MRCENIQLLRADRGGIVLITGVRSPGGAGELRPACHRPPRLEMGDSLPFQGAFPRGDIPRLRKKKKKGKNNLK